MQTLYGGIVIENSQLTSLSIFTVQNVYEEFNFFCETSGFYIRNNPKLTDISVLTQFYLWGTNDYDECDFRIENNPMLDVEKLYKSYELDLSQNRLDIRSSGNLKNFGCRGDEISSTSIRFYENCEYLLGGLKLNTRLSDLSSLENVNWVHIRNAGLEEKVTINIQNNPEMKKLGFRLYDMDFAYTWSDNRLANLENLHPDFCLTMEEMSKFLILKMRFMNIHARYCDDTGDLHGNIFCVFKSMSELATKCGYILGNVLIESGDEQYLEKLNLVQFIFGTVTITNTNLESLEFFQMLRSIASLDDSKPVIQIVSNKNLKQAHLPSLEHLITKGPQRIVIENNHPKLFNSSNSHLLFPSIDASLTFVYGDYIPPPH
ncbi:unnamed protein product [Caenorhabditis brenneri]